MPTLLARVQQCVIEAAPSFEGADVWTSFGGLGIDSVGLAEILAHIEKSFDVRLDDAAFFDIENIEELTVAVAVALEERATGRWQKVRLKAGLTQAIDEMIRAVRYHRPLLMFLIRCRVPEGEAEMLAWPMVAAFLKEFDQHPWRRSDLAGAVSAGQLLLICPETPAEHATTVLHKAGHVFDNMDESMRLALEASVVDLSGQSPVGTPAFVSLDSQAMPYTPAVTLAARCLNLRGDVVRTLQTATLRDNVLTLRGVPGGGAEVAPGDDAVRFEVEGQFFRVPVTALRFEDQSSVSIVLTGEAKSTVGPLLKQFMTRVLRQLTDVALGEPGDG